MAIELKPFKPEEYLEDSETQGYFLADALDANDPEQIKEALMVVAKARGVETLAKEIGMTKQGLYKAFGTSGDPKLSTVMKVMNVLGFKINIEVTESDTLESIPA